jgi:hypothetical protein
LISEVKFDLTPVLLDSIHRLGHFNSEYGKFQCDNAKELVLQLLVATAKLVDTEQPIRPQHMGNILYTHPIHVDYAKTVLKRVYRKNFEDKVFELKVVDRTRLKEYLLYARAELQAGRAKPPMPTISMPVRIIPLHDLLKYDDEQA